MNLLMACLEKDSKSVISEVFARATYFAIYNTESKEFSFIDNEAAEASSGAGVRAAQICVDANANVVIARRLGENSYDLFKEAGIKTYLSEKDLTLEELVEKADKSELMEITEGKKGFHHA